MFFRYHECILSVFWLPQCWYLLVHLALINIPAFVAGSIARSTKCRYISYSETDLEYSFATQGNTLHQWGEIWHGRGDRSHEVVHSSMLRSNPHAKFHHHQCNDKCIGPPKLKILRTFYQITEYKRPAGAYPLRDFYELCRGCTSFQERSLLKFGWICLRDYGF